MCTPLSIKYFRQPDEFLKIAVTQFFLHSISSISLGACEKAIESVNVGNHIQVARMQKKSETEW